MMRVLAVIPARGGSKGVPRKNIRPICGKPLIAYTIEAALAAREHLHRIVVSTDDDEIAGIAEVHGAEVPFRRPADLAGDRIPTLPALQHAVGWVEADEGVKMDWILLLQPTEPFRTPEDILGALALIDETCDSIISVSRVYAHHPILMKRIEKGQLLPYCIEEREGTRRQDYDPPAYMRNGSIYLTRRDVVMERNSIWGEFIRPYVMPEDEYVSIDTELDIKLVEVMMRERLEATGKGLA